MQLDGQWESMYARAMAWGSGRVLTLEAERIAATDELIASTLATLVRLGALAALTVVAPDDPAYARGVSRNSAGALRLLDRALAAHGRDNGYDPESWRQLAITIASASADELDDDLPTWMNGALERAAGEIALALTAVPRDRMGVPAQLAEAIAPLLLVVAATWQTAPNPAACHAPS